MDVTWMEIPGQAPSEMMAMNSRLGGPTWLIPAGLLALVGAGAVALWRGPRSAPNLDEICALRGSISSIGPRIS